MIHELFEKQAAQTPDAVAVVFDETRVSYEELNERANQLAHHLHGLGVGPEVQVGILLERSVEMIVGLLAVMKAGGAYVPLDPNYPAERLAFMIEDAELKVLLTHERWRERLDSTAVTHVLEIEQQNWGDESTANPQVNLTAGNLAYVIYTSGSTGRPKGVAIEHRSATTLLHWARETYSAEELQGVLAATSICFDLSVFELFAPLSRGGQVILAENALALPNLPAKSEVRLINTVPSVLSELLRLEPLPSGVRVVNLAGEALRRSLVDQIYEQETIARVVNLYGPSEDTTYSTIAELKRGEDGPVAIGHPLANTRAYVVDDQGLMVPPGVAGELWLGGEGLARGYLQRAELTAEKFVPDGLSGESGARLYRTGDLTRYLDAGNLDYLGRIDQQVKIRGMRVELGEIEALLDKHPAVKQAVAMVQAYGPTDNRLVAYVVSDRSDATQLTTELQKYLRTKLSEHMVPSAFVPLAALPLTPNGKLDRKALPVPAFQERKGDYVAPRTPVEETLAAIWSEVLGKDQIGVHDDFFSLGGHSLLATMVITRVRQLLKIELPQRIFFETATVAELARYVEDLKLSRDGSAEKTDEPSKNLAELSAEERAAVVMRLKKKSTDAAPEETIQRRKDSGPVPLSFAQQRLWFLEQMGYSNYIVPATSHLSGPLNVKALEQSLNEIVQRHEALRTTFTTIDGQPMQVIAPQSPLTVPVLDLTQLSSDERAAETKRLRDESLRPFNLERGPLLRASLLRLAEDEHLLLLTMHHIVSDGWSLGVFIKELAALYQGFVEGKSASLPELPVQYADFAIWQRRWLNGEILDRQLAYWKEQLGDNPPLLNLPTDLPRPSVPSIEGAFVTCELSKELTEALKNLSRQEGVSLYMTLVAAFKILLARYAGQDDVVIGTPIAYRNWIDVENLIGFFVNTLVLRTDLSRNPPVKELLKRVREVTLGAFAHQDVPFEKLVEGLQPERDITRTPFFQVMFSLQNAPMPSLKLADVTMTLLPDELTTAQFDLALDITERSNGMECLLEYSTKIFKRATVQRMLTHFTNLLESIVAQPEQRIRELALLSDDERRQILDEWNDTTLDYAPVRCIHQLFETQAERTPDAVAVVFGDEHVSYAELNQRANQLGYHVKQLGVERETRVGILLPRSIEMPVALLAVLKAGGAYVAFDPAYPPERLLYMIENSDVSLLLTQKEVMVDAPQHRARVVYLDAERSSIATHNTQNVESGVDPSNLAYLVYTSGSTGRPKGILTEHRCVVNAVEGFIDVHRMSERDRLLQFSSLSFDVAMEEFFATWGTGGCVIMRPEQLSFAEFMTLLEREEITIANLPASYWLEWLTALSDGGGEVPKSVRRVIVGNEKSLEETLAKWQRLIGSKVEWRNAYGPSETTITAANYEPSLASRARDGKSAVPIGRPVKNVQMYVLDAEQELVPTGVTGELYIAGPGVARGYHKQPAHTAERFLPNPYSRNGGERFYRSGDATCFQADGNVDFLGRVDEQVKIRGFRIELGEIEAVLAQHTNVRDSVVMACDDGRGGQRLVAYVVSNNGLRTEDLRSYLQQRLTEYMVPSSIVLMENLPRDPNGKIIRGALPDAAGTRNDESYIAPRSATERTIANIWQEVLKLEKVGINDNFFGLGGHSLLLAHAQSKVSEALRVKLSMIEMFKYPTVSALAEHLSEQRGLTPAPQPTRHQAETRLEALNRQRQLRQRSNQRQHAVRDNA